MKTYLQRPSSTDYTDFYRLLKPDYVFDFVCVHLRPVRYLGLILFILSILLMIFPCVSVSLWQGLNLKDSNDRQRNTRHP